MSNRLFVGNLPYDATEDELRVHFSQAGSVTSVFIPLDRETGRPRGFAFIEFDHSNGAAAAIAQLNQKPFRDRPLVVNEARPNEARPSGPPRPSPGGGRGGVPAPRGGPPADFGEEGRESRRASGQKPRRKAPKRGGWEEGPRKEPIPEKRRSQIFGGYDDAEFEEAEEDGEAVDFENFATGLPDADAGDEEVKKEREVKEEKEEK
jgi:RNA recognition motif-containing protein